jgi:hypothetical protein
VKRRCAAADCAYARVLFFFSSHLSLADTATGGNIYRITIRCTL